MPHLCSPNSYPPEGIDIADDDAQRTAAVLRAVADALLVPVAKATGIPAEAVQTFVEGSSVGSVRAARTRGKRRKVSAYNKAFAEAYRRRRDRHSKQDGTLRKGFDHRRLMSLAHDDVRRSMK